MDLIELSVTVPFLFPSFYYFLYFEWVFLVYLMPVMFVITSEGLFISYYIPYIHFIKTLKSCGDPISIFYVPNSKYFYVVSGNFLDTLILEDTTLCTGLGSYEIDNLQQIPWREYIDIANRAVAKMADEAKRLNLTRGGFSPVADGTFLSAMPFYSDSAHYSADIPMIISTTFNEQSPSRVDSALEKVSMNDGKEKLKVRFGEKSGEVADDYSKTFPDKKPVEIWSMILSNRKNAIATADAKVKQKAPVYVAWFGWQPPLFDGRMRAFHCDDNREILFIHPEMLIVRRPVSIVGITTAYDRAHVTPFYYSDKHSCPAFDYGHQHVYFGHDLLPDPAKRLIGYLNARYYPHRDEDDD